MQYLSHPLKARVPVYGSNRAEMEMRRIKSIQNGNSCNTYWIGMGNHWGTHIDAPAHFFNNAPSIADYPPEYWFFEHPCITEIPVPENALIEIKHLENKIDPQTDFLLLNTGFQVWRGEKSIALIIPGLIRRLVIG